MRLYLSFPLIGLILVAFSLGLAQAQDSLPQLRPMDTRTPVVPKPLTLEAQARIADDQKIDLPHPPSKDVDGQKVSYVNDGDACPMGPVMRNLISDEVLPALVKQDLAQKAHGKYYWFTAGNWDYCHYRDGDRNWYGWKTGESFHWVLFRHGSFWWRDNYAERWVYFYRGYWWWQSAKPPVQTQVLMDDKHYHIVDANGALGDDLWTTGTMQSITTPVAAPIANATPGQHHHGGHHGGGGTGSSALPPPSSIDNSN